ncbi:MAG: beta-ketoacyl-ACP synthase II [Anaerolineae bacterium]|uniref:beta-ketoacyl-ACP synthase II n=1 Tax=Promineifilum sp. TaxID=2664178 RepID=UPI001DB46281|nr:beta-ketoacyl-ACP synthase II [Anaerolineales bacterium]MCB8935561.1 beta-ketoacyl-ACP synthase II [Promineifilum sp.]MCO5180642.1 beta-ketoacyl-ACP synthase II [Promineifilum sp.]MCW5847631.1 beta-ketoacyl-ACP synthase II [Anaerolineae bacterium]
MNNETTDARGRPRVVITGMGMLSPLGNTVEESWENMMAGRSGIGPITQFDASELTTRIAGEVKGFVARDHMDFKEARRMSRASQLAVAAARMAVADAGLPEQLPDPDRTGVLVGTAAGGMERAFEEMDTFRERGMRAVSPFAMTMFLCNMPTHHVSLMTGSTGPLSSIVAACATGTQTIGEASEFIRRGAADMMFAGGVEGLIHVSAIAGFGAMRALSTHFNDTPERASRPFDKDRDGFILAEGAAIVVMERLDKALARGARIYGEVLGHASSSDAFHVAAPDPEAKGAIHAMQWAIDDAGLTPRDIDYINAHGTSTPVNDATETLAIKRLFGERAYEVPISSTKSAMGHAMGAAGTIESIFTILGLGRGVIPPTWNYETPDPECDLDYVPNAPRPSPIRVALKNSFGLGGQNACLVLGRYANGQED